MYITSVLQSMFRSEIVFRERMDSIDEFKRSNMEDYMLMIRDFEIKKREVDPQKSDKPVVAIKADKLKVDMDVVRNIFKIQIEAIVDHVSNLLDQSTIVEIGAIVLVGGFNDCPLLQQSFKSKFDDHTIIVPNDADLAVFKGAVIFGHKPELISQRVSIYTNGIEIRVPFIEHVHKESYKIKDEDGKHITAGQCLVIVEAHVEKNYHAVPSTAALIFKVYYTLDPNPIVGMIYGETEIEVEVTKIVTGSLHRLKIDFLV
ncbi:HS12A-like protein [Mya arenaria]|uniref:HS12A-like protein n=1 Tax=Mya arenaria TaxID=6604 RepID=A0ABY7G0M9_MYAAR|nr:HS12A-like protein [Mya arenaria]